MESGKSAEGPPGMGYGPSTVAGALTGVGVSDVTEGARRASES